MSLRPPAENISAVSDLHWPPPAGCGPLCRCGPLRGRWPPRCHTVGRSSWPQRWPSGWRFLHTQRRQRSIPTVRRHLLIISSILASFLLLFTISSFVSLFSPRTPTTPPPLWLPPQSFTRRTSTFPLRRRFLGVSSEVLPDSLVCWYQVIVDVSLTFRAWPDGSALLWGLAAPTTAVSALMSSAASNFSRDGAVDA